MGNTKRFRIKRHGLNTEYTTPLPVTHVFVLRAPHAYCRRDLYVCTRVRVHARVNVFSRGLLGDTVSRRNPNAAARTLHSKTDPGTLPVEYGSTIKMDLGRGRRGSIADGLVSRRPNASPLRGCATDENVVYVVRAAYVQRYYRTHVPQ